MGSNAQGGLGMEPVPPQVAPGITEMPSGFPQQSLCMVFTDLEIGKMTHIAR